VRLKLIDLGNAVPIERTSIYYSDFEVQSLHYRAPEVLLGLPFNSAIDMFSLGLILAELLLSQSDPPSQVTRHRQPSFPTSPPQSHSPQPLHNLPLLSTFSTNRRSYITQMVNLFGPLPQLYKAGEFWSDDIAQETSHGEKLLSQRLEDEGVDSELIDFIMRMLELDPEKRITAGNALRHEWLVGPLLGYWAAIGVEWIPMERRNQSWQRPVERIIRDVSESQSSSPEGHVSPETVRKLPPLYDFSMEDDEEDEEVSFVFSGSSPTKPLPFSEQQSIPKEPEEEVQVF
jgi:serine/threonine protein kinase